MLTVVLVVTPCDYLNVYAMYDPENRHPFPLYRRPAGITDTILMDRPIVPDQLQDGDVFYLEMGVVENHKRIENRR